MLLQLQLYLEDTTKGYLMQGETILYRSSSLDLAVGRAEDMLQSHSFAFGVPSGQRLEFGVARSPIT